VECKLRKIQVNNVIPVNESKNNTFLIICSLGGAYCWKRGMMGQRKYKGKGPGGTRGHSSSGEGKLPSPPYISICQARQDLSCASGKKSTLPRRKPTAL